MLSRKRDPDQVAIAFGSDPGRELVWTWRTSADVTSTAIRVARLPKGVRNAALPGVEQSRGLFGSCVATRPWSKSLTCSMTP